MMDSQSVSICNSDSKTVPMRSSALSLIGWAMIMHYLCFLPVMTGVSFGLDFLTRQDYKDFPGFLIHQPESNLLTAYASWDGAWYADIVRSGYKYDPKEGSHVVFFPIYPSLASLVSWITGASPELALLLISHTALIGSLAVLKLYLADRFPHWAPDRRDFVVIAMLCLPCSAFLRMAYSESLFLLFILVALYGVQRQWHPWEVAVCFGAASGVRAVGAGLVLVSVYYAWTNAPATTLTASPLAPVWRLARCLFMIPLSLWGLIGFMTYLYLEFGDPFVFQSNHVHYDSRSGLPVDQKLWNLITLEPIWSVYTGDSLSHWTTYEPVQNPQFTLRFMNPIYFALTCTLIGLGKCAGILNRYELLLSAILVAIPYVTKGHDGGMLGMGRYMSVVFPAAIVLGYFLWKLKPDFRSAITGLGFSMVALNSAQFAAWYMFF